MTRLDLDTVTGLWTALAREFRSRDAHKATSCLMRTVAWFLATIRVLPREAFLRDFTTTIGRTIYLPFDRHAPCDDEESWRRLALCVHEHQHVAQWQRGALRFVLGYLLSKRRRTEHEAEAYGTALELAAALGRPLPDPAELAARLASYGLGPDDIRHAEALLRQIAGRAQAGEVTTEATRVALAWLQRC